MRNLLQRLCNSVIAWLLKPRLQIAEREIGNRARQEGETKGFEAGYASGKQEGYTSGKQDGLKEGFDSGLAAGRNIWEIRDLRSTASPGPRSSSIYGPTRFSITDEMQDEMRLKVNEAVDAGIIRAEPSDEQWEMIFSDHPATCVAAGAGSGKSTTLVLRVVFMVRYLKIDLHDITVVSFTRKSCEDLRRSLIAKFAHWGYKLAEQEAKNVVRTFHSALHRAARSIGLSRQFFEYLGNERQHGQSQQSEDTDDENPFSKSRLTDAQLDLLHDVYQRLYESDAQFRQNVMGIIRCQLQQDLALEKLPDNLMRASRRDEQLVLLLTERWTQCGCWPIEGIEEGPFETKIKGFTFYANGRVTRTGEPVFLGHGRHNGDWLIRTDEYLSYDDPALDFGAVGIATMKRQVLSAYLEGRRIYLRDPQRAALFAHLLHSEAPSSTEQRNAPVFEIQLQGELNPQPLSVAFWSQGSFIESLGKDVNELVGAMESFSAELVEHFFVPALAQFWKAFNDRLESTGKLTYNRCFRLMRELGGRFDPNSEVLRPFKHLLIDEFQDISPQIQKWLIAFQERLADDDQFVSIMAVGDDWQSIYGWRGSSPDFLIHFDRYFQVHERLGGPQRCLLTKNFRSIEPIVVAGNSVLELVENKWEKTCVAAKRRGSGDLGITIVLFDGDGDLDNELLDRIEAFVRKQRQEVGRRNPTSNVFVMSRKGDVKAELERRIGEKPELFFLTYHGSKGLEAETTILVGNDVYEKNHRLRNRIYRLAELSDLMDGYDQAARDEAHRTAYVALTRAECNVYWFVDSLKGASKQLVERANVPVVSIEDLTDKIG